MSPTGSFDVTAQGEELYRNLFEKGYSIMLVIDPQTGDIVDANSKACEFYGYSRDELRRMLLREETS